MSARTLNRDEWRLMGEIIALGGSATASELIERNVARGWHVNVSRSLVAMQRKGRVVKSWDHQAGAARWTRVRPPS
jgi:hypothetical protein